MSVRISYRVRQFWRTIFVNNNLQQFQLARDWLTQAQWELFTRLQPSEQAHALRLCRSLIENGDDQRDLIVAALLHDVGKLRYRLNPLERAVVVVVKNLLPGLAANWGELPLAGWDGLPGWRKAFVLARHHPAWGAELAHDAGVSPLTEELIRHHQHLQEPSTDKRVSNLHEKLWSVDNED